MEYANRTALITGASEGIGRAAALMLAKRGVDTVLLDIKEERLKSLEAEIRALGRRALAVVCDMGSEDDINAADEKANAFAKTDILINNAAL